MINPKDESKALSTFREGKIITLLQLSELLRCSARTAQRRLQQWGARCSYNHNGRFHTLPRIPQYDGNGLWRYRGVFFSKHGNLRQTVIHLVRSSVQGLGAAEIGALLHLAPHSFIWHFRDVTGIRREKWGNRFLYFSDETDTYQRQREARTEAITPSEQLLSEADAILILVDRINHPSSSIQESAERLRRRITDISPKMVTGLLDYHGVEKKTPDTGS